MPTASESEAREYLKELTKKINTNDFTVLKKTKHPVEFYFETYSVSEGHDGIYDVVSKTWTRPPRSVQPDFDPEVAYSNAGFSLEPENHRNQSLKL